MQRIVHVIKQYDVILTAFKPALRRFFWILFGVVLGMLLVYVFVPVKFENNAEPVQMGDTYRDQWLKGLAAEYETWNEIVAVQGASDFNPVEEAQTKLVDAGITTDDITRLQSENADNAVLVGQLEALKPVADSVKGDAQAKIDQYPDPGFWNNVIVPLLGFLGMLVVLLLPTLLFAIYGIYELPIIGPIIKRLTKGAPSETDMKLRAEREARAVAKEMAATQRTIFDSPPVTQFMSTYLGGDNYYDDSFAIELADANNTFLGECGSGIADTIGVGDPKKVTATEVWIFDKNDISTVTHVLMSEHAFNDDAIRAKLAARGEPVLAAPGATTILETQTLRAQIRIVDMQYGDGALPPHSFFDRLTVEIAVWQKEGEEVIEPPVRMPMGSGTQPMAPMPQTPPPQYAPPPPQPAPQFAPPPPMQQPPMQPYPQQPPPQMPPQQRPPQGIPPQGMPPQQPPMQPRPPQQPPQQPFQGPPPGIPPQGGGGYTPPPRAPMPPQQQPPGQQPPSPFGDTGEVNY